MSMRKALADHGTPGRGGWARFAGIPDQTKAAASSRDAEKESRPLEQVLILKSEDLRSRRNDHSRASWSFWA